MKNFLRRNVSGSSREPWNGWIHSVGMPDYHSWSFATDNFSLVAVRDGGLLAEQGRPDVPVDRMNTVRKYLTLPVSSDAFETSLDDLWKWMGSYQRDKCICVDTDFPQINRGHCNLCNSTGWVERFRYRLGRVAGSVVNVDMLVRCLPVELLEFGGRFVRVFSQKLLGKHEGKALIVDGESWRVVVCNIAPEAIERHLPPVTYIPGAGDACRGLGHVPPILADWYEDRGEDAYASELRGMNELPW